MARELGYVCTCRYHETRIPTRTRTIYHIRSEHTILSTRYYTCLFPVIKDFDHHFLVLWHNFIKWKYSMGSWFRSKVGPCKCLLKHSYNPPLTKSKLLHGYHIMMTSWHDVSEILTKLRVNITPHNYQESCQYIKKWWQSLVDSRQSPASTPLTHWGRVTHICTSKTPIIGSDNGLSPGRRHIIAWTIDGILQWNLKKIKKKMYLIMPSGNWRPFCLGLNVLTQLDVNWSVVYGLHRKWYLYCSQYQEVFTELCKSYFLVEYFVVSHSTN